MIISKTFSRITNSHSSLRVTSYLPPLTSKAINIQHMMDCLFKLIAFNRTYLPIYTWPTRSLWNLESNLSHRKSAEDFKFRMQHNKQVCWIRKSPWLSQSHLPVTERMKVEIIFVINRVMRITQNKNKPMLVWKRTRYNVYSRWAGSIRKHINSPRKLETNKQRLLQSYPQSKTANILEVVLFERLIHFCWAHSCPSVM